MNTQAIGIDFGTTKTLVACLHPGEKRPAAASCAPQPPEPAKFKP